jgi:serine/threonine protein kinase
VDNWSVGCIFAELLLGKPLLQGKTEMEQLDLIFKLCGTPTAGEVSKETRELPHAAAFLNAKKPHQRRVQEVFRRQPKVRGFLFFSFFASSRNWCVIDAVSLIHRMDAVSSKSD